METVSNIAGAASRAIWGETPTNEENKTETSTENTAAKAGGEGKEPISGELGNTKKGEPFDMGNSETTSKDTSTTNNLESATETAGATTIDPLAKSTDNQSTSAATSTSDVATKTIAETTIDPLAPKDTQSSTSNTNTNTEDSNTTVLPMHPKPSPTQAENPIQTTTNTMPSSLPAATADISPSNAQSTGPPAGLGSTLKEPSPEKEKLSSETEKHSIQDVKDFGAQKDNLGAPTTGSDKEVSSTQNLADVPAPATSASEDKKDASLEKKDIPTSATASAEKDTSIPTATGKEEDRTSGDSGKYVRATGVQAEGGNFDATKPGAGHEAERLMGKDQKEATKSGESLDSKDSGKDADSPAKEGKLTHLKEKIKEKLHHNKNGE